ncbi:NAD(P)/FAD-dependent oxidoreductase [Salinisphaera sp. P385]|uniref:NAD(P)/FAD-dependent oxidoreductase n=1 Tax=Spectribacter acetivorans TaxID=3075603 RepID=A0ABU3B7T0_9GAMM|nr:NAD(P)/FAD-dependent oxidoreductase [Salinisphaera sp. P385]MDT0618135.1 NAD(P)/FAD-dependent oxidoreductase [Salinisphaera sp. P385]
MRLSRRELLRAAAGLTGLGLIGPGWSADRARGRVVIVGGGFGGATCARYLRAIAPGVSVTLIERRARLATGPFCNTVVAGINPIEAITVDHRALAAAGVNVIHADIRELDPVARRVRLPDGGKLEADHLVVAPGIDFDWFPIEGYGPKVTDALPHAWTADRDQITNLRQQLQAMPDDGVVAIAIPPNPYRCPPGPYERASLIGHFLTQHKPRAKLLLLDAKDHFSKEALFRAGWAEHYGERIEWIGRPQGGAVVAVDAGKRTLITAGGERIRADVINVIPPQVAGALARDNDLTDISDWAPVDHRSFESTRHPRVHVLGDACQGGPMPKSGYAANVQGKICAHAIAAGLAGDTFAGTRLINACYSLVTPDHGISVSQVYDLNGPHFAAIPDTGGTSPLAASPQDRARVAGYARSWYRNIVRDTFGNPATP